MERGPRRTGVTTTADWGAVAVAVLVLGATCVLVHSCHQPPPALGLDAPPEHFSAGRAHQILQHLLGDQSPHPLGSAANEQVRARLLAELEDLGLQPVVNSHWVAGEGRWSSTLALAHNIVAELPTSTPDRPAILLACHHDSVPAGPGASDDGAGMAAMLEIARILKAEAPLPRPVVLLFTDGEELDLFGARGFVLDNPIAERVGLVLNFEARGSSGGSLMFETSGHNRWMIKQAARGLSRPMSSSAYVSVYGMMPNSSDLTIFMQRELAGMNFAFIGSPKHYHTPLDNLENLDLRSLQHHGDNVLGMTRQLLGADWEGADDERGDAVYTDLFARWIVAWPASWGPWMAGSLLLLVAVCVRRLRKRFAWRTAQIARTTTCWLLVSLAGALAGGLGAWLLRLSDPSVTSFPAEMHYDVTVHCLGGAIGAVLILALFRPEGTLFFLINCLGWATGAAVLSVTMAGFSYVFLLPAVLSAIAVLVLLEVSPGGARLFGPCIVLGMTNAIIGFPFLMRLPQALGVFFAAPVAGALAAFLLLPIAPLLCRLSRRSMLRSAVALTLVAAAFFVLALKSPAFTPDSPQQIRLSYLEQAGRKGAQLSVSSWEAPLPSALAESAPVLEAPHPLFTIPGRPLSVATAGMTAPRAELLEWTTSEGLHTARFRLVPSLPFQQLLAGIPASLELQRITAREIELAVPPGVEDGRKWIRLHGGPEEGSEVSLSWRGPAALPLVIAGITPGLPAHLSEVARLRDSLNARTAHLGDESIVLEEVVLRAP